MLRMRAEDIEGGLFPSVDQTLAYATVHPKDEIERVRPEARDLNDFRNARRVQTTEAGACLNVFKRRHAGRLEIVTAWFSPPRRQTFLSPQMIEPLRWGPY
jgi:hypothetical protein